MAEKIESIADRVLVEPLMSEPFNFITFSEEEDNYDVVLNISPLSGNISVRGLRYEGRFRDKIGGYHLTLDLFERSHIGRHDLIEHFKLIGRSLLPEYEKGEITEYQYGKQTRFQTIEKT